MDTKNGQHDASVDEANIVEVFFGLVKNSVDENGVYPQQCVFIDKNGQMVVNALMVDGITVRSIMVDKVESGEAVEMIFGMDIWTKAGQGTTLSSAVVVGHFRDGKWRVGVIEYLHKPRIVKAIDWDNAYWADRMRKVLRDGEDV